MADNDQLLQQIRKIVQEENEPLKKDITILHKDIAILHEGQGKFETKLDAVLAGQEELQKTTAREASLQDVKVTLTRKVNDHEERITELEKEAGIPHPHKH